ncbi:MAG: AarF/UbiB family protein [Clostridia bacterium]|nr:AarF/UbiB family protein [Clostridia bacterium]
MKKIIKSIKPLYWLLKNIYSKTILRLKNGHFKFMKEYKQSIKANDFEGLEKNELKNIKIWNFDSWKFDSGLDHSYRRYYTARYHGKKCFVKIAKNDLTVLNEIFIAEQNFELFFSPKVYLTNRSFNGDSFLIVQEYIGNLKPLYKTKKYDVFEKWCGDFVNILDVLSKYKIVHNDIHKGNLLVRKKDNRLFLLDYGISTVLPDNKIIDYKARPGTFYKKTIVDDMETRIYDDAYSFVQEMYRLQFEEEWLKKSELFKEIEKKVGKTTFTTRVRRD